MPDNTIDTNFERSVNYINNLPKTPQKGEMQPTIEEKVLLYGLFKQATLGDCDQSKPWAVQFEKLKKWTAWNELKGMGKDEAKQKYYEALVKISNGKFDA